MYDDRLVPINEVKRLTGIGKSKLYASIRTGEFPAPVRCGASSRWLLSEISQWIRQRVAARDALPGVLPAA
jgi:predicted DNA-binding transcriptional regulator AlpA